MDIIRAFTENNMEMNIMIKGTYENPLFRASDVGEVLSIKNIYSTISNYDDTQRINILVKTVGGEQSVVFLTEYGLFDVLFLSRKPIAKKFRHWVCQVIHEIRLNGKYDVMQQQIEQLELINLTNSDKRQKLEIKNRELEESLLQTKSEQEFNKIAFSTTPYIYIYNLDTRIALPELPKLKIGYSMCLKNRMKPFNTTCPFGKLIFSQEIKYLNDVSDPTSKEKELRKLETSIHYKLSRFHDGREIFQMDIEDAVLCVINEYNNFKLFNNKSNIDRQIKLKKICEMTGSIINDEPINQISKCDSSTQTEYNEGEPLSTPLIHGDEILIKKFNDFIDMHCLVRNDVEVSAKDIQNAYKIYSREAKKEITQAFTDFLNKKFIFGRMHIQNADQAINGYRGLKLKDIEYKKQNIVVKNEETCVFACCVFAPSKTVLFSSIVEEYKNWKRKMGQTFDVVDDVKKLKEYLKQCPYILPETVWSQQGSGQGYYGLGLLSEVAYHRKSSTGCRVQRRDLQDNILNNYDTIAKAALVENICAAKMSRWIRDRTINKCDSGEYYYCKENNKQ
jgi:prophage antirepressor-like protein